MKKLSPTLQEDQRRREERERAAERLAAPGERSLLLGCRPGYWTGPHWILIALHPLSRTWRMFVFDDRGCVGDYGAWWHKGFAGLLLEAYQDFGADLSSAREVTPQTVDRELAVLLGREAAA